jgi:hypothetical protein
LPHRSNAPPYPYNNLDSALDKYVGVNPDPFMGDHSCCLGDPDGNSAEWQIAPAGTICYEQIEYGALTSSNDVYKRGSVWRCDGLRGNICAGEKEDLPQELVEVCPDTGGPDGICQGPGDRKLITASPQQCENYYGPDFDNNACNNLKKCSTQTQYDAAAGTRLCFGGCDGFGGCTAPLNWELCESVESREQSCLLDASLAENRRYSLSCSCASNPGDDTIECSRIDLDTSQNKCIECGISWLDNKCCGDDLGETVVGGSCSS